MTKHVFEHPTHYQIKVKGRLDMRWTAWFNDMTITTEPNGITLITGPVADQAALHGILNRIRDLAIPLLSVKPLDTTENS